MLLHFGEVHVAILPRLNHFPRSLIDLRLIKCFVNFFLLCLVLQPHIKLLLVSLVKALDVKSGARFRDLFGGNLGCLFLLFHSQLLLSIGKSYLLTMLAFF